MEQVRIDGFDSLPDGLRDFLTPDSMVVQRDPTGEGLWLSWGSGDQPRGECPQCKQTTGGGKLHIPLPQLDRLIEAMRKVAGMAGTQ